MAVDLSALAGDAEMLDDDTDLELAHQAELEGGDVDELPPDLDEPTPTGTADEESASAGVPDPTQQHPDPASEASAQAPAPAEPAPAVADSVVTEPDPDPQPFVFRADGQKHTLDGALDYPGHGIYIPEAMRGQFKQFCAAAQTHNGTWRQREREMSSEIAHHRERADLAEKEANALTEMFKPMLGMTREQRAQWAWEFGEKMPDLFLGAREQALAEREQRIRAGTALSYQPSQDDGTRLQREAVTELDTTIEILAQDPAFKVLSEADWDAVRDFWGPQVGRLVAKDPRTGTVTFDGRTVQQYALQVARVRQDTASRVDAKSAAAAANARKLGTDVKPPPTVAGRAAPSAPAAPSQPRNADGTFATKEDWENWSRGIAA